MFPILQLGPLALQVPGLLLLLGVWVGLNFVEREARRLGQDADAIGNLVFTALVAGLIGARLWYASRFPSAYLTSPLGLLSLNPWTLDLGGGVVIGVLAAMIYGNRKRMKLRPTLDAVAPGTAMLGIAVALSHAASGDAFGAPTRVPWSVYLWNEFRHPSQFYELIGALAVLGMWGWSRGRNLGDGVRFLLVIGLTAGARLFLEAFRGDSVLVMGGFRAAQWACAATLAVCLVLLDRWGPRNAGATAP